MEGRKNFIILLLMASGATAKDRWCVLPLPENYTSVTMDQSEQLKVVNVHFHKIQVNAWVVM